MLEELEVNDEVMEQQYEEALYLAHVLYRYGRVQRVPSAEAIADAFDVARPEAVHAVLTCLFDEGAPAPLPAEWRGDMDIIGGRCDGGQGYYEDLIDACIKLGWSVVGEN